MLSSYKLAALATIAGLSLTAAPAMAHDSHRAPVKKVVVETHSRDHSVPLLAYLLSYPVPSRTYYKEVRYVTPPGHAYGHYKWKRHDNDRRDYNWREHDRDGRRHR